LPHNWLTEVFRASVYTERDQISAIDVLFTNTPLALLCAESSFLLELAGFALCLGLPPRLKSWIALGASARDEEGEVVSAATSTSRAVYSRLSLAL
jgi:hypothetical protein